MHKTPIPTRIRSKPTTQRRLKQQSKQRHLRAPSRRDFSNCSTSPSSCCGGGCGSGSNDADGTKPAKKVQCDPYGLDGHPLSMEQVELQVEFALDNRWAYNTTTNQLSRTFQFSKSPLPKLEARIPGAPAGPCHQQPAIFTFLQAMNNISTNNNHWAYQVELVPRKPAVTVHLKTVGRAGITYADINLASHLDSFFATHMVPKGNQDNTTHIWTHFDPHSVWSHW